MYNYFENEIMIRKYTNGQINKVGETLRLYALNAEENKTAIEVISDWRAAHSPHMNNLYLKLSKKCSLVDKKAIVVSRLKKIESIKIKLENSPKMELARMQDIGGCRAIVRNISKARYLYHCMLKLKGGFVCRDVKDYVKTPKSSGYRGHHIVYESNGEEGKYRNFLEIQIRTELQHAWATMVETVSLFTDQKLKSGLGEDKWKQYFSLVSKLFEADEMKEYGEINELKTKIKNLERKQKFMETINGFRISLEHFDRVKADYYLLRLDYLEHKLLIKSYAKNNIMENFSNAKKDYIDFEAMNTDPERYNAVLVSANRFEDVETGYQNYFANTKHFIDAYNRIMSTKY